MTAQNSFSTSTLSLFSLGNITYHNNISFWIMIIAIIVFLMGTSYLITAYYQKKIISSSIIPLIINVLKKPLLFLMGSYIIYAVLNIANIYFPTILGESKIIFLRYFIRIVEFTVFFWLIINAVNTAKKQLLIWSADSNATLFHLIFPMISNSLQALVFLVIANILIAELSSLGLAGIFFEKLTKILLIGVLGWIFIQLINIFEKIIINQYINKTPCDISARKIHTQVILLKKLIVTIGIIITIASILMVFDSVKNIGVGLLTTAGLVSAAGAFASQQSLGRLFAGLQIAFTQPIKIGDAVIIDNEFGEVEEITLSYIVIKLWDLRRLILPSDYFTSRSLQNLTRSSTQLLGTIFIYADYTLPVNEIRQKFYEFLSESLYWDKKVKAFDMTDIKENAIEIRALMSANSTGDLWNLRCEMREKIIGYIVKAYPHTLPRLRYMNTGNTGDAEQNQTYQEFKNSFN